MPVRAPTPGQSPGRPGPVGWGEHQLRWRARHPLLMGLERPGYEVGEGAVIRQGLRRGLVGNQNRPHVIPIAGPGDLKCAVPFRTRIGELS